MKVKNRCASAVVYNIPDLHIRRRFTPGEVKEISEEELTQLKYQPGGEYLLVHYLQVERDNYHKLGLDEPEREYFYTDEQIKDLITKASLEEFLDALDYAPEGVIDLFQHYSTILPMSDLQKIEAFKQRTGFDVAAALKNNVVEEVAEAAPVRKRRVDSETVTHERRVEAETPKYNIISEN
jgi:hypothetical protein